MDTIQHRLNTGNRLRDPDNVTVSHRRFDQETGALLIIYIVIYAHTQTLSFDPKGLLEDRTKNLLLLQPVRCNNQSCGA